MLHNMRFEYRRFGFKHEIIILDWGFIVQWTLGIRCFPWEDLHVEHDFSKLRGTYLSVLQGDRRYVLPNLDGLYWALHRGLQQEFTLRT